MNTESLKAGICKAFCSGLTVATVPAGFVVSTALIMPDGDPLTFYVVDTPDGLVLEDDGDFLSTAIAAGIPIDTGTRKSLLEGILTETDSYLDRDTFQIRSRPCETGEIEAASLRFASGLVRARDLMLLTQDFVSSTFAEDLRSSLDNELGERFVITSEDDADNPADIVLRHRRTGLRAATIFAANSNEKLMAALIRHNERQPDDAPVIAPLDKEPGKSVSIKRFMMAQNRGLLMPFYGVNPRAAVAYIGEHVKAEAA